MTGIGEPPRFLSALIGRRERDGRRRSGEGARPGGMGPGGMLARQGRRRARHPRHLLIRGCSRAAGPAPNRAGLVTGASNPRWRQVLAPRHSREELARFPARVWRLQAPVGSCGRSAGCFQRVSCGPRP